METRILHLIIPHTAPVLPVISGIQHASSTVPPDEVTRERADKILLLNNSIFLKAEFAKQSYRIIDECYSKYGELLEDGGYLVRPTEIFPAWREIDNLIFELGSILDFFSREINLAYNLGIKKNAVGFSRLVRKCKETIPNEPITQSLVNFSESKLHTYFRGLRNRITHRLPFVFRGMNDQIFLPDNPNDDDVIPKTKKQIDVGETCRRWLYEILEFVDQTSLLVFKEIAKIQIYNKNTGKEITLEEFIETHKQELEARLGIG